MPRKKEDRNPFGTILEKTIEKNGKKVKVWDVRKRYPATDKDGKFLYNEKTGKKIYKDKTQRCYSKLEANSALLGLPAKIKDKKEKTAAAQKKIENKEYTFRELVARFTQSEVKPAVFIQGRKVAGYKQDLESVKRVLTLLENYFGDKPVKEFTFEDLENFRNWYALQLTAREKLPAVSTVNEKISFLRRIFNFAIEIYWLDVSPFKRGRSLVDKAGEAVRNRMLTFEEEERLLAACVDFKDISYKRKNRANYKKGEGTEEVTQKTPVGRGRLRRLIIAALDTAMRRGEIFNLEWWQIDFDRRVIYLTEEAAEQTKTGKGGVLPMTGRLHAVFSEIYHGQDRKEKVFKKYDPKKAFAGACEDAGIDNLQFRDLRSTGATRMVLAGNDNSQVMKVTRHTRLKTFVDHYTNVDIINAQTIGKSLDDYLKNENDKVRAKKDKAA